MIIQKPKMEHSLNQKLKNKVIYQQRPTQEYYKVVHV